MLSLIRVPRTLVAALLLAAGTTGPAWAQSDPPDRVARLNYISGQVSFRPASLEEWGVATINYPLTTGDHLWTEPSATAELHVSAAVLRLAPETAFSFLDLTDDLVQVRLAEGTLDLRVRELYAGETYEIDTPNAAISILRPGIYHIDVNPDGERTRVTVRDGEAEVDCGHTVSIASGQLAEFIGVESVASVLTRAAAPDRWELWCRDRDTREDNRLALDYVPRDMVGYEDLDDYGTWTYVPEYGYAWEPTVVAVDWAPYRYGHWSWVRPWGWTWIDDSRWGFAPFHYGRWTSYRDHWIWLPGQRHPHPIYAPALVAFVGSHNWMYSFSFGTRSAVGWFPLGPGEPYRPTYHASPGYLRNVNVGVTTSGVTAATATRGRYANRDVPGAVTAVPRDVFVGSQPVQRVGTAVPRAVAAQTTVVGHGTAVKPGTTSVLAHIPAAAGRPPASVTGRAVVARVEPPETVTQGAPVVRAESRRPRPNYARVVNAEPAPVDTGASRATTSDGRNEAADAGVNAAQATAAASPRRAPEDPRNGQTYMYWPSAGQPASSADRPQGSGRPRDDRPPSDGTGNGGAAAARSQAPGYQAPVHTAPRYDAPTYQGPRNQYETPRAQAMPRDDRPATGSERPMPRADRPVSGRETVSETPPSVGHAPRPRTEERPERAPSPAAPAAAPAAPPAPAASPTPASRPAERAAERPAPQSGAQSDQSARPRPGGGRGGPEKK